MSDRYRDDVDQRGEALDRALERTLDDRAALLAIRSELVDALHDRADRRHVEGTVVGKGALGNADDLDTSLVQRSEGRASQNTANVLNHDVLLVRGQAVGDDQYGQPARRDPLQDHVCG